MHTVSSCPTSPSRHNEQNTQTCSHFALESVCPQERMRLSILEGPVKPARYICCGFTVHNDGFVAYIQFSWSSWGSIVNMQICDTILFFYLYDYTQLFSPVRICIQYFHQIIYWHSYYY